MNILDGLKRGNPNEPGKIPAEYFADPNNVKEKCIYDGTQISPGVLGDQMIGVESEQGFVTIGGAGGGKSLAVLGNLIHYKGSIAIIDPKNYYGEKSADWRAKMGNDIYILAAGIEVPEHLQQYLATLNPMERLDIDSDTLLEDIGLICDALIISNQKGEIFWTDSAQSLLEGVVGHVQFCPLYGEGKKDLVTVSQLISRGKNFTTKEGKVLKSMEGLVYEMLHNADFLRVHNEELAEFIEASALGWWERAEKERGSVLSTLRTQLKFLKYKSVRNVLRDQPGKKKIVDLADLKRKKMTIYLSIPVGKLALFNRLMRLFVNVLLEAVEREKEIPPVPLLIVLEEFPVLDYMRSLEIAAGFVRGFHCKLHIIVQNLGQIQNLYKDSWETFLGNNLLQFFANNDQLTLDYIEKRCGKTPVQVIQRSISTSQPISDESVSVEMHPLITAQEAARFFGRDDPLKRQLVIWPGFDPIILQRTEWFKTDTPYFKRYFEKFYRSLEKTNK